MKYKAGKTGKGFLDDSYNATIDVEGSLDNWDARIHVYGYTAAGAKQFRAKIIKALKLLEQHEQNKEQ